MVVIVLPLAPSAPIRFCHDRARRRADGRR
jgi:hypothetical protein